MIIIFIFVGGALLLFLFLLMMMTMAMMMIARKITRTTERKIQDCYSVGVPDPSS